MEPWLRPLHDAGGMRAVDRWAIDEQGVPEADLIEAAGGALADVVADLAPQGPVRVLCGKGNNGADGSVAARRLASMGFDVDLVDVFGSEVPDDLDAWLEGSAVVVDAIFGTGFEGTPREPTIAPIEAANRCGAPIVACDIASGVDASTGEVEGVAVEASTTVAFHAAKIGHRVAPGKSSHRRGWSSSRSGSRRGRRSSRRPVRSMPPCSPSRPTGVRRRPSSAPGRWRSPVARAASPGRSGCRRWRRSEREPATPRSPCRPTSSRSSRSPSPRSCRSAARAATAAWHRARQGRC